MIKINITEKGINILMDNVELTIESKEKHDVAKLIDNMIENKIPVKIPNNWQKIENNIQNISDLHGKIIDTKDGLVRPLTEKELHYAKKTIDKLTPKAPKSKIHVCAKCGKQYIKTGNCQKYCTTCKPKKEKKAQHKKSDLFDASPKNGMIGGAF